MSRFDLNITKDDTVFTFTGAFDDDTEPFVSGMLAAVTEGLEANGFDVDASLTLETRVGL